ncbi:MAG: hypothetical protein HUK14_09765 [Muribaculaceae bacterium]|nr:hypothetical protein [Muribaculaceae bacterium]
MAGFMCACGSKGAANEEGAATDSTTVEAVEAAAPAADLPYADQVKAAVELITKAVNEKNGDVLVQGITAYVASFDAVKSMEEFEQVNTQYNIDKVFPSEADMKTWVSEEQMKKIQELNLEGAAEKALSRIIAGEGAAPAEAAK